MSSGGTPIARICPRIFTDSKSRRDAARRLKQRQLNAHASSGMRSRIPSSASADADNVTCLGVRGEQRHERVKVRFHAALHHVAHHSLDVPITASAGLRDCDALRSHDAATRSRPSQ